MARRATLRAGMPAPPPLELQLLLILSVGFITFAVLERQAERRRAENFSAMRLAYEAQEDLMGMETALNGYLLTSRADSSDLFKRRENAFLERLSTLATLLPENREKRHALLEIAQGFRKWEADYALPEMAARRARRENTIRPAIPARPQSAGLQEARTHLAAIVRDAEHLVEDNYAERGLHQLFQTGGLGVLGILAISFLAASSWRSYQAFRRHLEKAEMAGAQIRAIIANTLDGVITVDENGVIQSLNPAGERMFTQTAAHVIGQNVSLLIPQRLFFNDMKNAGRGAIMAVGQRQGYYPFPIEISVSAMEVMGRKQFVAMVRDVSERQRSEDTLRQISIGVSTTTGEEFLRTLLKQLSKALRNDYAFLVELAGNRHDQACSLAVAEQGNIRTTGVYDLTHTACAEVLSKGYRVHLADARN